MTAARRSPAEKLVRAWCNENQVFIDDLDVSVKDLMNTYTWYLQCIPGNGTRRARCSTAFNVWNWRRAAITYLGDPKRFNLFLTLLVHANRGFITPGMMSNPEVLDNLEAVVRVEGVVILDDLLTHCQGVIHDFSHRVEFDPMGYEHVDCFSHWVALQALQQVSGMDLSEPLEDLAALVTEKWRLFFPRIVLLLQVITKETQNELYNIASRFAADVFTHAFGHHSPGCSGPASLCV